LSDIVYVHPIELPVKAKIVGVQWVWQKDDETTEYVKDEKSLAETLRKTGQKITYVRKPSEGPTSKLGECGD
jgi:hypothetical protein